MTLKVTDLKLDISSLGDTFILADVIPNYVYDKNTNKRTDEINGYKYVVVLPKLKMARLSIKVEGKPSLFDLEDIPVGQFLNFEGLDLKMFQDFKTREIRISASANNVELVED